MGWRLSAISQNLSYSLELTSTMGISHRMLGQNEQVIVALLRHIYIVFSYSQPYHNIVALFELKVLRNSCLALLFSIMQFQWRSVRVFKVLTEYPTIFRENRNLQC